MKFIHLSDLHLGKRVHDVSMIEDQRDILTKILAIIDEEAPDCVILAGDIYDKAVPTAEATALFDDFLVRLAQRRLQVFAISGNHDSPERIAFGSRLMDASGIHLSPVYDGSIRPVTLTDDFGPVHIYMLPFVKPMHVRRFFQEEPINTYTDAIGVAIGQMQPDFQQRNVLITHQFVTGASRSESEEITVGGVDNVDATVFQGFDYVALGHIHPPELRQSRHPLLRHPAEMLLFRGQGRKVRHRGGAGGEGEPDRAHRAPDAQARDGGAEGHLPGADGQHLLCGNQLAV